MGIAKKRVSPKIANNVNRDLDNLMIYSIVQTINKLDPPWKQNTIGRPCWNPRIVSVCCFIKIFFHRTYDGTEAYLKTNRIVTKLLHVDKMPGHSVIARGMENLSIVYLRKVLRYITLHMRRKGINVIIDSTGFTVKSSSKWFDIRMRRISDKQDHIKLHIIIDAETLTILHFTITDGWTHDSKEFQRLINTLPQLGKVIGDKGYSSRKNCQVVADKKGIPYLAFKANTTTMARGCSAWKISFNAYMDNPVEWMAEYHIRSVVESVFASIKRCWGSEIRCRKSWLKRRELSMKVVAYNVKRMLYIERAEELGIPLWISSS
jgi:transposase